MDDIRSLRFVFLYIYFRIKAKPHDFLSYRRSILQDNLVIAALRVDILARASLLQPAPHQLQLCVVHRINLYLPELQVQASGS